MTRDSRGRAPDVTAVTAVTKALPELAQRGACLIMIVGNEIGRRIELSDKPLVIGRSGGAQLQLELDNVSRAHAEIRRAAAGYIVRDLDSTNGTFVNDLKIDEHALSDGDQIRIGRAILKFITGSNVEMLYHEEIYRLMTLDGLTQVFNRRYFTDAIEKEIARSQRYQHRFSVVLFDIDHFKRVNDTHGHLSGDAVLRRVAMIVRGNLRANDVVARIGGEEFALILPEVALEGALALAEKLRRLVEADSFSHEGTQLRVTISLGAAEWSADIKSADELLKRADLRLYEAKDAGRNAVR